MKRKAFITVLILAVCFCVTAAADNTIDLAGEQYPVCEQIAVVNVTDEVLNTVKSGIFGVNNGYRAGGYGIYDESTLTFNEAMLQKIAESGVTHIREPGGTEGDYFHWYECVGPVESRISQINPFSTGYPTYTKTEGERYDVVFGPDEWIEMCKRLDMGLTIQLNSGTGTPQEAVDFIRYCLDSGVKIESIAVGNEACMQEERVEGIQVTCTPEEYVAFYNEVLRLMGDEMLSELRSKNIPFGCIGLPGSHALSIHRKWDSTVLSNADVAPDIIDIHIGYSPFGVNLQGVSAEAIHLCLLASSANVKKLLDAEVKTIKTASPDTMIKMSEYGPIGSNMCYGTAGAMYMASFYNTVLAEEKVISADYLPLCFNVTYPASLIGANTNEGVYWDNVLAYVFRMYSEQIGRSVLAVTVDNCRTFKAQAVGLMPRQLNVPEGEAAVYYDAQTGEGTLFLLNKAYTENTVFDVTLPFASVRIDSVTELWSEDPSRYNTQAAPEAVVPAVLENAAMETEGSFTVTAKPVSLIRIDFSAE